MGLKVLKFGGTSMADASSIKRVCEIVKEDPERRFVIVSAPGKRFKTDKKVTDLLYVCYHDIELANECRVTFSKIRDRFLEIASDLNLDFDIASYLHETENDMLKYRTADFCASRGEYLSALVLSKALGYEFIDATELIVFNEEGEWQKEATNLKIRKRLKNVKYAVIPGFYGMDEFDNIKTFSRGGSDITGAIIAGALEADVYENWTDVNGFMVADPRIIENPKRISTLTYRELRELAYMGADVLHPESIFPVRKLSIPINIRNTFEKDNPGTRIVSNIGECNMEETITGIAGRKGYSIIYIEKSMMNSELGFARKVLSILETFGISFEHMPSGIDTISVVIAESDLGINTEKLIKTIKETVSPDKIEIINDIAIIAVVGHGMSNKVGTASIIFTALAKANINIRMIDQGSSELNIILGVQSSDYENAIKAIYKAFIK